MSQFEYNKSAIGNNFISLNKHNHTKPINMKQLVSMPSTKPE